MRTQALTYLSFQYPWPAEVNGLERIALSAQGDLQRVLRYVIILDLGYAYRTSRPFLLLVHSLLAQSSSPSYTLKQSVRLPYSHPQSPSSKSPQVSLLLPLPIPPSSKLVKYTFNAQGKSSAPQLPLSASPLQNAPTYSF